MLPKPTGTDCVIQIRGLGAVSPAGWGVRALEEALQRGHPIPTSALARPGWPKPLRCRRVPRPDPPPEFLRHPRLRRSSPVSHFAMAAALEAVGDDADRILSGEIRLGLIFTTLSGGVNYSIRFYEETLENPAMASPVLFPETVFNAPASHLASYFQTTVMDCTFVGDVTTYLEGLAVAAQWLELGLVDACLVVAAEEKDWITADGLRRFSRRVIPSEGAGAVYLKRAVRGGGAVFIERITDAFAFIDQAGRARGVAQMRGQLEPGRCEGATILGTRQQGVRWTDQAEEAAWASWIGDRIAPLQILGEGLMAATAWQVVATARHLERSSAQCAWISVPGLVHRCMGLRLEKSALEKKPDPD